MFENRQQLIDLIEQYGKDGGLSPLEAVIEIQEKFNIESETLAALIRRSPKLKALIKVDAVKLRLVHDDGI